MPIFRIISVIIILALQWYLYRRLLTYVRQRSGLPPRMETAVHSLFLLFNLPVPLVIWFFWKLTHVPPIVSTILTPFYIWHMATLFIAIVLGTVALIRWMILLPVTAARLHPVINHKVTTMTSHPQYRQFDASRRKFLETGVIGLSAYSFIGATTGAVAPGEFEVNRVTIPIPGLPEQFKGFTIGMMSDIHSSIFMNKEDMLGYVREMNALRTDLIVVTGDFVNSKTEEVYPFAEAFSELKAPHGVYGCLGNHDFFTKNVDLVAREIDDCGVKLLRNDALKIHSGDAYVNLLGVDDIGRNTPPDDYLNKALAFANNAEAKILLCHKPYYFHEAKERGIGLTLSGHTHGGQIVFGTVDRTPISLAALASKYVSGLYSNDGSHLYVNNGIGYTGIPFRINCPAELTVITLA